MATAEQQQRWRAKNGVKAGQLGRPATASCGTTAAYKRHLRHGETPCAACRKEASASRRRARLAHRARSSSLTAAQTAIALAAGDEETRLLLMREFVRGWNDIADQHRASLVIKRPPLIGHPGWDALLAGCVEYLARRDGVSVPVWVSRPEGWSPNFFFPVDLPSLRVRGLVDAPVELARRGVMLDIAALEQEPTSP